MGLGYLGYRFLPSSQPNNDQLDQDDHRAADDRDDEPRPKPGGIGYPPGEPGGGHAAGQRDHKDDAEGGPGEVGKGFAGDREGGREYGREPEPGEDDTDRSQNARGRGGPT